MKQLMQPPQRSSVLVLLPIAVIISALSANAAALLLDFGPTAATGTDRLLDPGHSTGIVPASELTWNRITADTNTLYYGDGTPATGVTLNLGRSTAVGPVGNDIPDHDGATNYQEFLAGTDPRNATSVLRVSIDAQTNTAILRFLAVSNRAYTLQYRDSLAAGSWLDFTNLPPAMTNRTVICTDSFPFGTTNRYYRVSAP